MRRVLLAVVAVFSLTFSAPNADAGLFGRHHGNDCCGAAPACGCDVAPSCGCEVAPVYAPSCGCEVAPAYGCCDAAPACGCGHKHGKLRGLFGKHHNRGGCCDAAPACGCDAAPSCGCGY